MDIINIIYGGSDMFRNMKMKTLLSLGVGFVSLICLTVSGLVIGGRVSDITRESAIENMNTSLAGQASLIELFVSDSESMLKSYASADEITNLLKEPENPEYIAAAQTYTEKYFSKLSQWEGIYLSNWDTKVLAHSSAGAVGMVTRTGDALEPYRQTMTSSADGFFNGGAFVSPASNQLIFNLRMAIYGDNGEPMGFVGGGPFISGLNELLGNSEIEDLQSETYAILDSASLIYAYHSDSELITAPVEDSALLAVAEKVKSGEEGGVYYDSGNMIVYRNIPGLNLIVTMQDSERELLSASYTVINIFIVFIAVTEILVIIATVIVSKFATAPLKKVTAAVNTLGVLSLNANWQISGYAGKKSEVGRIATSVSSLTKALQNIVATLSDCSRTLNSGAKVMMSTVSSLSNCANDNTVTAEELSSGVNFANGAIQKVNTDIVTISRIMSDSRAANLDRIKSADKMMTSAERMFSEITNKTAETETDINKSMGYLNNFGHINDNVTRIQSIARQTQLLAINASIESSKAGEAGKGFAVVAAEIKDLSENSSKAADAIYDVCVEMNANIGNIKSCFEDIISFLKNDIVDVFNNMQDISENLKASIEGLNSDMDKISGFVSNISKEARELNGVVEKNEYGVENISSKVQITYSMVQKLNDLIVENMETARNINEVISNFS